MKVMSDKYQSFKKILLEKGYEEKDIRSYYEEADNHSSFATFSVEELVEDFPLYLRLTNEFYEENPDLRDPNEEWVQKKIDAPDLQQVTYEELDYTLDNRDTVITEIHFERGNEYITIELHPWSLLSNLLENLPAPVHVLLGLQTTLDDLRDEVQDILEEVIEND